MKSVEHETFFLRGCCYSRLELRVGKKTKNLNRTVKLNWTKQKKNWTITNSFKAELKQSGSVQNRSIWFGFLYIFSMVPIITVPFSSFWFGTVWVSSKSINSVRFSYFKFI